jgi:hypothetical protein
MLTRWDYVTNMYFEAEQENLTRIKAASWLHSNWLAAKASSPAACIFNELIRHVHSIRKISKSGSFCFKFCKSKKNFICIRNAIYKKAPKDVFTFSSVMNPSCSCFLFSSARSTSMVVSCSAIEVCRSSNLAFKFSTCNQETEFELQTIEFAPDNTRTPPE